MGLSKRIWIENDPAYADVRAKFAEEAREFISQCKFSAPLRRKNRVEQSPYWDPYWRPRLNDACEELKLERGRDFEDVNWQRLFLTEEARDAARKRAEQLWADELERRRSQRR